MFKKTIEPKNKGAKISALIAFIGGTFMVIMSSGGNIPLPWLAQGTGIALITYSIYIVSACLFRKYTVIIDSMSGAAEDGEGAYDFIIYELGAQRNGARERKICDVSVKHIDFVRVVDKENKKDVARDRKEKDKYTYDAQFAASRRLEVSITNGGEVASILLTYDEDILNALLSVGVKRKY